MADVQLQESVHFYRHLGLPGVEVREVRNTGRTWSCYATEFEFMTPSSWHGEIQRGTRKELVQPGSVFASRPSEVFSARRVIRAGSGRALTIEPETLSQLVAEHDVTPEQFHVRQAALDSPVLLQPLLRVLDAVGPDTSLLEVQCCLIDFIDAAVGELVHRTRLSPARANVGYGAGRRVLDYLHQDTSGKIDLAELAREVGISRFQALRAFKRQFGLPPHNYHLRLRLGLVQRALRSGQPLAQIAADYGFVDQSHMSRHFKRFTGLTPGQYAQRRANAPMAAVARSAD